ncbi:hypothetical protein ES705_22919 [subsurface metagenome]|jgi:hypothetical protein
MTLHTGRRAFRLPSGEGVLTRLTRVEALLKQFKDGQQPPKRLVAKCLVEYQELLKSLWLWGFKKR